MRGAVCRTPELQGGNREMDNPNAVGNYTL